MDRHADKSARDDRAGGAARDDNKKWILGKRAKRSFFRKTSKATNPNHTTQAARLKNEKRKKSRFLNKQLGGRILRLESGLSKETSACAERCPLFCKASKEIRLVVYRRREPQTPCFIAQSRIHQNAKS